MKRVRAGIENYLMLIFLVVNSLAFAALSVFLFRYSYVNIDFSSEFPTLKAGSAAFNLTAFILMMILIMVYIGIPDKSFSKVNVRSFTLILSVAAAIISVVWVIISGAGPQADQYMICDAASEFNRGYFGWLEKGQYLAIYPQNLGLVNILRCLFAIFGDGNYLPFQILSAVSILLVIFGTGLISESLTDDKKIRIMTVAVTFFCVPMYLYTPFVYGDVLSIAFGLCSIAAFIRSFEKAAYGNAVLYVITLLIAVTCRKNTFILAVAFICVCILKMLSKASRKKAVVMILLTVFCMVMPSVTNSIIYREHVSEDAKPMPALLWVQMGFNSSEGYYGSGWNDFSNLVLYAEAGYDPELAEEMAKARLEVYRDWYRDNPRLLADFMKRKITTQWAAPMYQAFVMNSSVQREQAAVAKKIYYDPVIWRFLDKYMNLYQLLIYFGTACAGFFLMGNFGGAEKKVGLIAVFGGLLFSMIWEAKSRYVFPYLFMLIPYGIFGVCELSKKITGAIKGLKIRYD